MASESGMPNPSSRILTFYPTMEEFKNFSRYIAYIETQGAHRAGLAKVVPPKEWKPCKSYDDIDDLVIPAPIQQVVTGQSGLFTQYNIQKKPITVREFRKIANSDKYCTPRYTDFDDLERKYWKNLTFNPPIYGADVNGTLYDEGVNEWNIGHLNTILDVVEKESGITIEGVNTPYLYFGMWKTTFAWHTEDMDLYSINYLHFGEPKSWYTVPPEHGKRLERLAKGFFPGSAQSCEAFLRHKMTLISPSILKKYGIPFDRVTQEAGDFMITFPYGYHAGFNHGFNCAESTNFASLRWIEYGKHAVLCSCRKDMVKISMDVFVRKFQPERYKLWKLGKDTTFVDHTQATREAVEFYEELKTASAKSLEDQDADAAEVEMNKAEKKVCIAQRDIAETKSPIKHRIGTKRHKVCLELPQEMNENATILKEGDDINPLPQSDCEESKGKLQKEEGCCKFKTGDASPNISESATVRVENAPQEEKLRLKPTMSTSADTAVTVLNFSVATHSQNTSTSSVKSSDSSSSDSETTSTLSSSQESAAEDSDNSPDWGEPVKTNVGTSLNEQDLAEMAEQYMKEMKSKKKAKSRRQPLSKPPRHHPLSVVKDCVSDEEMPDLLAVEDDPMESEPWAKPLAHLWQNRPQNFLAEREYNSTMAQLIPYCSICALFQLNQVDCKEGHTFRNKNQQLDAGRLRNKIKSKPLVPEMCFTSGSDHVDLSLPTSYIEEDGTSTLVTCAKCCVCVHASCYGVAPEKVTDDWICARCSANALSEDCCLCTLRGGALQKTTDNRWVHLMCAVAVQEVRFVNVAERRPVDVSPIPPLRWKLKCFYCKKRMKKTGGCCVQCSHGRCPTSFHVTCAQAAGVIMQPDDWPFVVFITCCRHKTPSQAERSKSALNEIEVGQKVISKHKNGRFYQCEVVGLSKETFYEVNFDDGSFSDNLYPEDIVSRDCLRLGPPAEGEVVQVRWTDGLVYGAQFVASHVIQLYQVEFEDASQLMVKREDVYTLNEELPKKVKSRLSVASDMRFTGIFAEEEVAHVSKRQRVLNSRYRGDYVEPSLYRTIME
ncbi:lysine-specific demethylase 4A-like [Pristis pectinata]|uniref:lysine-specific demethylase 4A-like n=1 Tax=Pristis pectinata TaxID=685728 RepID=UPI00223D94E1|nr:lysine-specific demethylase 4A-like [Pristis pectinata]XP_051867371.1 lysine-specific demethylase 4A-like [Pristis pectinata]XP_051867372.1 lysine-specific demethylase 4A-like [Pristis pectinata]XP_051867373.1 lysine-specific demethylase 4A-like [Pristis pectinata]XP_051867374.1 lysine-specific demethylase 4A-like [Pristis pectinata]